MHGEANMRPITLAILATLAVIACLVALGMRPDGIANHYRETLPPAAFALWFAGLIVATLSPPIVALACWFGGKKMRHGWLLHVLLLPITYAAVRGSIAMMLTAANEPDSDGPTGWATDPALMLMLLCPLAYFAALALRRTRVSRTNDH